MIIAPRFISTFNIGAKFGGGAPFDPDAQAWIDRMTAPSSLEQTAINDYVLAEKADSNFALKDYEIILPFGATNGLIDAFGLTAINEGGVSFDVNGGTTDGTSNYIRTGLIPSTGYNNASVNDVAQGGYIQSMTDYVGADNAFGANGGSRAHFMGHNASNTIFLTFNNNLSQTNLLKLTDWSDHLIMLKRKAGSGAGAVQLDVDGVSHATATSTSTGLPTVEMYIGASNLNGSAVAFTPFTIASYMVSAEIGFDWVAHNTNLTALLTTIGTI